jgi:phosphate/sulfate permease
VSWAFVRANPRSVEPTFQCLQFAAASLISLGHGGNDAQKTMGVWHGVVRTFQIAEIFSELSVARNSCARCRTHQLKLGPVNHSSA